jgi:hypothetical protein
MIACQGSETALALYRKHVPFLSSRTLRLLKNEGIVRVSLLPLDASDFACLEILHLEGREVVFKYPKCEEEMSDTWQNRLIKTMSSRS